jgi:vacuolar-type H+-ATPase subunit I/STV1
MDVNEIKSKVEGATDPTNMGMVSSQMMEYLSSMIDDKDFLKAQELTEAYLSALNEKKTTLSNILKAIEETENYSEKLLKNLQKANKASAERAAEMETYKSDPNGLLQKRLGHNKEHLVNRLRNFVIGALPNSDDDDKEA